MAEGNVLVIDDDRSMTQAIAYNLNGAGYFTTVSHSGFDGLRKAEVQLPQIVLLDVGLPDCDGFDVCRRLRSVPKLSNILIVLLTARTDETDQLIGFTSGADDYVMKPFSIRVLLERLRALRRQQSFAGVRETVLHIHGIRMSRQRHEVIVDGSSVRLTRTEFNLLEALVRSPGRVYLRRELIEIGLGADAMVTRRTIDVHIAALRRKLGRKADLIETVRGTGYRFRESLPDEASFSRADHSAFGSR